MLEMVEKTGPDQTPGQFRLLSDHAHGHARVHARENARGRAHVQAREQAREHARGLLTVTSR